MMLDLIVNSSLKPRILSDQYPINERTTHILNVLNL